MNALRSSTVPSTFSYLGPLGCRRKWGRSPGEARYAISSRAAASMLSVSHSLCTVLVHNAWKAAVQCSKQSSFLATKHGARAPPSPHPSHIDCTMNSWRLASAHPSKRDIERIVLARCIAAFDHALCSDFGKSPKSRYTHLHRS